MEYLSRIKELSITRALNESREPHNVFLLAGARQCGKSTLLEHAFPDARWLNLAEDGEICEAIDQTRSFDDFTLLLKSRYQVNPDQLLVIDEAQLSKRLGGYVRFMKEKWRRQKVILTGSTLSLLFRNHQKPTGRVTEEILRPFNFLEFLRAVGQEAIAERIAAWTPAPKHRLSQTVHEECLRWLEIYLRVGGLPEVVKAFRDKRGPIKTLADIFAFYRRDYESKLSENLWALFGQIFLRIAGSAGSSIKLSSIVKTSEPLYKKLAEALSLLEQWHLLLKVDIETHKLSKVSSMTPKRYLFDLGIRYLQNPARFQNLSLRDVNNLKREDMGGLIENFVACELHSLSSPLDLRAWSKTHQSGHIDFIYSTGTKTFAIEVKSALSVNQKHTTSLKFWNEVFPGNQLVVANLSPGEKVELPWGTVVFVPVYALFSYLASSA